MIAIIGFVLLAGLGVAVAQRGNSPEPADELAQPTDTSPTTTTVTTSPEGVTETTLDSTTTTLPGAEGTTTRPVAGAAPTSSTTTTRPADPGARPTFPQLPAGSFYNPFKPFDPFAPAPLFPTQAAPEQPNPEPNPQNSRIVQPRPGMANLHKTGWDRADILNGSAVRLHFVSGVEPCTVLNNVEVQYRAGDIVLTIFEGSDPANPGAACIQIVESKAVDVQLSEPINGRALTDGAG